jgi:hypothetical protein
MIATLGSALSRSKVLRPQVSRPRCRYSIGVLFGMGVDGVLCLNFEDVSGPCIPRTRGRLSRDWCVKGKYPLAPSVQPRPRCRRQTRLLGAARPCRYPAARLYAVKSQLQHAGHDGDMHVPAFYVEGLITHVTHYRDPRPACVLCNCSNIEE